MNNVKKYLKVYNGGIMTVNEKKEEIKKLCDELEQEKCFESRHAIINKIKKLQGEIIAKNDLLISKMLHEIITTNNLYATDEKSIFEENKDLMFKLDSSELFKFYDKTMGE